MFSLILNISTKSISLGILKNSTVQTVRFSCRVKSGLKRGGRSGGFNEHGVGPGRRRGDGTTGSLPLAHTEPCKLKLLSASL